MGDVLNRGTKAKPLWYCRYVDTDGKRKQKATKQPTKALAEQYLASIEARIARGEVGIAEPTPEELARKTVTVRELWARFIKEYAPPKIKSIDNYRRDIQSKYNRIDPVFGARAAASVTSIEVERFRDGLLAKRLAPASVTLTLAALSKLYSWARRVGAIDCTHPVAGCERPRATPSLDYFSRAEVTSLLAYTAEHRPTLYPLIATAIYTGMRKGELFGLRWSDVHLDARRVDVARSYRLAPKSGKPRHLPVNAELASVLEGWRDGCPKTADGLVFPVEIEDGRLRMGSEDDMLGIAQTLAAAKCHRPAKPWHALRHTFASHFMMSGGNILTLQKLLGHSTVAVTMIYAHLAPDFMAGEVARMTFGAPAFAGAVDH